MHSFVILVAKYAVVIPALVITVYIVLLPTKKRLQFLVFFGLSCLLTALFVKLATTLHQDPRPFIKDGVKPYFESSTDNGFPSDHSAFAAVIAFCIMRFNKWIGLSLLALAILIGTARVVSGVHHTQDIIGGIVMAGTATIASYLLIHAFIREEGDRQAK